MLEKVKRFLEEARHEFRHINWPTFAETRRLTLIVIGFSLALAAFLGLLDLFFTYLLNMFIIS